MCPRKPLECYKDIDNSGCLWGRKLGGQRIVETEPLCRMSRNNASILYHAHAVISLYTQICLVCVSKTTSYQKVS